MASDHALFLKPDIGMKIASTAEMSDMDSIVAFKGIIATIQY